MRPAISPLLFLTQIPDWRDPKRIHYPWETLWTVILVGLLSGPENILARCQWIQGQREVLSQHLALQRLPQQAMIYRFFWALEQHQAQLHSVLLAWVQAQHPTAHRHLVVLAGDGKVLRGSGREGQAALSFLSVFFHELALTVTQTDPAGRHEAKGMGEPLGTIQAVFGEGWLLTLDAAYTQRDFTAQVIEAGGAYLVPLKNNVKDLKEWAVLAFSSPTQNGVVDVQYRSGEVWERRTDVLTDLPAVVIPEAIFQALPGIKTLIRREHRVTHRDRTQTREVR